MSILNHDLPHYRIAVVGAGAVGCFYGGRLAQYGRDVHFLMLHGCPHIDEGHPLAGLEVLIELGWCRFHVVSNLENHHIAT